MNDKIILRCSTDGVVNIPKETYKELGWKLNEPVEVCVADIPQTDDNGNRFVLNEVRIRRVKDLPIFKKGEEDYEKNAKIALKMMGIPDMKGETNGTV